MNMAHTRAETWVLGIMITCLVALIPVHQWTQGHKETRTEPPKIEKAEPEPPKVIRVTPPLSPL